MYSFIVAGVRYEDQQRLRQASGDSFQGWKIHVHDPGEFPEVRKKGIFVGLGKEVSVRYLIRKRFVFTFLSFAHFQPERHSDGGHGGCEGDEPNTEKMFAARGN